MTGHSALWPTHEYGPRCRSWPRSWHLLYWRPLILSVVVTAVLDTLDTGEGFGHGRSGLILSAPSRLLHTDSNAPMRSPRGGCYPLAARLGLVTFTKKVHHLEEILIWFECVTKIKIKTFSKKIKQDYKRKNNVIEISKRITITDKSKCNMMLFDIYRFDMKCTRNM